MGPFLNSWKSRGFKKLCTQVLAQITSSNKFWVTADEEFMKRLRLHDSSKIHPQPPPLFKCTLDVVDFQVKKISFFKKTGHLPWP